MKKTLLLLALLAPFSILKSATCTWNGNSGNWDDPANWVGGTVPGPTDDVVYMAVTPGNSLELNVDATVNNFTFGDDVGIGTCPNIGLGFGGNGNLTINGNLTWNRGSFGDAATVGSITVNGLTTVASKCDHIINKKTLNCNGGLLSSGTGYIRLINANAVLNVPSGQNFTINTGTQVDGSGTLNLYGNLIKNGTGSVQILAGVTFNNNTTFHINNGTFYLWQNGTHTGVFDIASGATLHFVGGTQNLNGASLSGTGTWRMNGGTINLNTGTSIASTLSQDLIIGTINDNFGATWGDLSIKGIGYNCDQTVTVGGNFLLNTGSFKGLGNMNVAGTFTWQTGSLGDVGVTGTITVNGLTTLQAASSRIYRKTLVCNGGFTMASGDLLLGDAATINIPAGKSFLVSMNGQGLLSGNGTINMSGTFTKTGTGPFDVPGGILMANTSTFNINNGTLGLGKGTTHTGVFNVAANAGLNFFGGGTNNLNGATIAGSGNFGIGGGTVNINSGTSVAPTMNFVATAGEFYDNLGLSFNTFSNTGSGADYFSNNTVSIAGNLTLSYGTFSGSCNINVGGIFYWGGRVGDGSLGGTLTVTGLTTTYSGAPRLYKKNLVCNGGLTLGTDYINLGYGSNILVPTGQSLQITSSTSGIYQVSTPGSITVNGTFNKSSSGTFSIPSGTVFNNTTTCTINNGTLELNTTGSHSGVFNIASGATLKLASGTHTLSGGTIAGTGTFDRSAVTFINNGTVAPGFSPGTLAVTGAYTNNILNWEIAAPGTTDLISASGAVTLAGTLNISRILGGSVPAGTYPIVTGTSRSGTFSTVNYPSECNGNCSIQYTSTGASLVATAALPIELTGFSAKNLTNGNDLRWQTGSERESSLFEIERSSQAGAGFEKIGEVPAAGQSSGLKNYGFLDAAPLGESFYRLKMVGYDGQSELSKIVFVKRKGGQKLQIFPNPVPENELNIQFDAPEGELRAAIFDALGRLVFQQKLESTGGFQNMKLEIGGLPSGNHRLELNGGSLHETAVFLKN